MNFDCPSVSRVQRESSTFIFSAKSLSMNFNPLISTLKCYKEIFTLSYLADKSDATGIYMCISLRVCVQVYLLVVPPFPTGAGPVSSSFLSSDSAEVSIFFSTGLGGTTTGGGYGVGTYFYF